MVYFGAAALQFYLYFIYAFIICNGHQYPYVTYGSVIKLLNKRTNVRLHSHEIKYGSGSGQQSVTGSDSKDDVNSHWFIKPVNDASAIRGEPVKCNSKIELEHVVSSKNLHSHNFQSPLSHKQEVSCFGENGIGDSGDTWTVICADDNWKRDEKVRFKHVDTEMYLTATGNKYGHPIHGQYEIVATSYMDDNSYWQAVEGVFIQPNDFLRKNIKLDPKAGGHKHSHEHTEL